MDTTRLGEVAADLMESIAEEYEGRAELGIVAVVAEVNSESEGWTCVQYRCSDDRRWVQAGLFEAARRGVHASSETDDDAD